MSLYRRHTDRAKRRWIVAWASASVCATLIKPVSTPAQTVDLTWAPPTADGTWDVATTKNFKPTGGSGSQFYFQGDSVLFDDTAAVTTITLASTGLTPTSVTVNTDATYKFMGTGSILGGASLIKNGSGTLTIANPAGNPYTGGTTVNGGVLLADKGIANTWTPWGSATGTVTLNNDGGLQFTARIASNVQNPLYGVLIVNGDNRLYTPQSFANQDIIPIGATVLGSGTLSIIRPASDTSVIMSIAGSMISFVGTIKYSDNAIGGSMRWNDTNTNSMVGGPSVTFNLGAGTTNIIFRNAGSFMMGQLMGGANSKVTLQTNSTMTFGQKNLHSTFNGALSGGSGGAYVKAGSSSAFTLTTTHGYTAQTIINEGTLALVNASPSPLANSPTIAIASGATLDLTGLNSGNGIGVVNNQTLRSNGSIVGGVVTGLSGSTIAGTNFNQNVVLQSGATLAPGNSVGTLTAVGLSLNSASLSIEADSTGIDKIVVTQADALTTTGFSTIAISNLGGVVPGTYTLIDYAANSTDYTGLENNFGFASFAYVLSLQNDLVNTRLNLVISDKSGRWFKDNGSDAWGTASNWTSDYIAAGVEVPSSVEFGTFITAPQTVTIGAAQAAVNITFNSPASYTIAGTGTLTLDSGGTSNLSVLQGTHTILPTVRLLHDVQLSVAASSNITFGGTIINANNAQLTKVGAGSATFARLNMNSGSFTVSAGAATLTAKATANSPTGTSVVRNLSISAGAKLNLTNNSFVIDTAINPLAELEGVRQELADGRLISTSSTTTTALGYRTNAGVASPILQDMATLATFGGIAVDSSSVLIRLTLKGDSNLDGDVDIEDLYNLANNFLSTTANWYQGDFNYDGIVNATDLSLLAVNWEQSFAGGEILGSMSLEDALTSIGGLGNPSVPEPSTLTMAGAAAMGLMKRHRRRHLK